MALEIMLGNLGTLILSSACLVSAVSCATSIRAFQARFYMLNSLLARARASHAVGKDFLVGDVFSNCRTTPSGKVLATIR